MMHIGTLLATLEAIHTTAQLESEILLQGFKWFHLPSGRPQLCVYIYTHTYNHPEVDRK